MRPPGGWPFVVVALLVLGGLALGLMFRIVWPASGDYVAPSSDVRPAMAPTGLP